MTLRSRTASLLRRVADRIDPPARALFDWPTVGEFTRALQNINDKTLKNCITRFTMAPDETKAGEVLQEMMRAHNLADQGVLTRDEARLLSRNAFNAAADRVAKNA